MADDLEDSLVPVMDASGIIVIFVILRGLARLIFWLFDKCLRTLFTDLTGDFGRQIWVHDNLSVGTASWNISSPLDSVSDGCCAVLC
jgi:hypothetical protein